MDAAYAIATTEPQSGGDLSLARERWGEFVAAVRAEVEREVELKFAARAEEHRRSSREVEPGLDAEHDGLEIER